MDEEPDLQPKDDHDADANADRPFAASPDFDISLAEKAPAEKPAAILQTAPQPDRTKTGQPEAQRMNMVPPIMPQKAPPVRPADPIKAPEAEPHHSAIPQKAVRTYEGDVAEVLANKKTSTASIAIAESRRREQEDSIGTKEPSHIGRKALVALASLILVGVGVAGAYYLYSISPLAPLRQAAPQPQAVASLVPADSQAYVAIDNLTPTAIEARIESEEDKPQAVGTIKEIILTKMENGQATRVTGPDMATIMDIGAPDILLRSLTAPWMLGVYAESNGTKAVFVIVTTDFFQNAFAGMLQWESVMADDLRQYIYPAGTYGISNTADAPSTVPIATSTPSSYDPLAGIDSILPMAGTSTAGTTTSPSVPSKSASASNATSTKMATSTGAATSTPPIATTSPQTVAEYPTLSGQFVDQIISNKDVREFKTTAGQTLFLYSFIDNVRLVVTSDEATLAEILARVEKQAFVR